MKRLIIIIAIIATMIAPVTVWAAGSCEVRPLDVIGGSYTVTLTCTGDATDGTVPNITIPAPIMERLMFKYYLYHVWAFPTADGVTPTSAAVTVQMRGVDLLGGQGTTLINNLVVQDTFPYSVYMSSYFFPIVADTLIVGVSGQNTNSANFTIILEFVRI